MKETHVLHALMLHAFIENIYIPPSLLWNYGPNVRSLDSRVCIYGSFNENAIKYLRIFFFIPQQLANKLSAKLYGVEGL